MILTCQQALFYILFLAGNEIRRLSNKIASFAARLGSSW